MPATVLCARANAQINHGGHKYGANQSWWCPGFDQVLNTVTVVGSKPDELPVEHELIDGAWYNNAQGFVGLWDPGIEWFRLFGPNAEMRMTFDEFVPAVRMAPVARYGPPAPEVKEPTGLGAVVTDRLEDPWVRGLDDLWHGPADTPYHWDHIPRPVVVCSEGWRP